MRQDFQYDRNDRVLVQDHVHNKNWFQMYTGRIFIRMDTENITTQIILIYSLSSLQLACGTSREDHPCRVRQLATAG
jgi:hypothetical protein